jgi:predicted unusual protein kinase regulating ubiquinone biosynthesis (AarF/ABC1/UbiB family)
MAKGKPGGVKGKSKDVSWEKAVDEAIKALKPELDFLREYDLKAKASASRRS